MLARLTLVIILKYTQTLNYDAVHLKLKNCCILIAPQL